MSKKPEVRPSELVLLAIHNLDDQYGVSEHDIIKFISIRLNIKPEEVKARVKAALARSLTLQLITQRKGKFKMFDVANQSVSRTSSLVHTSSPTAGRRRKNPKRREKPKIRKCSVWPKYNRAAMGEFLETGTKLRLRCECCGRRKRLEYVRESSAMKIPRPSFSQKVHRTKTRWCDTEMGTKAVPAKPSELVILAINNLEEKDGSTSHDIAKFISQEFMMKQEEVTPRVQEALKRALTYGILVVKDGKYKLHDFPKQTNTTNASVDETRSSEPDTSSKVTRNSKAHNKKSRKRASPVKKVRTKKKLPVKTARKTKVRKVTKKTCKRCLNRAAPI